MEHLKTSTPIYNGRVFKVKSDVIILPNGKSAKRDVVETNNAVAMIAVVDEQVMFVKQYRHAVHKDVLEIPAGKIDAGEDPVEAAVRELEEEIGYKTNNIKQIYSIYSSPGFTSEKIHIYLCSDLVKSEQKFDTDEFLDVVSVPLSNIPTMLSGQVITDAKSVVGLYTAMSLNWGK